MPTQAGSFSTLMVALALFGLAGSAVMVTVSRIFAGSARPDFTIFLVSGVAVILALILAATLAYRAFDEVERRAVRLGDATLLAGFFWMGLALILLYHAMWVVFLLALVSIWPFRTYTPK